MKNKTKKSSKTTSPANRTQSNSKGPAKYLQSEDFISRVNQDGTCIVMHLSDVNSFFKMNKMTAVLWPELRQARTVEGAAAHFAKLLPKHAATIEKDMKEIFQDLLKHRLIVETDEEESKKFETPKLEMAKYERGSIQVYNLDKIETEILNESIYLDVFAGSDMRLKKDVAPVENALAKISALDGVHYSWRTEGKRAAKVPKALSKKRRTGLIAQQVVEQMPELVRADQETGLLAVNYAKLNAYLVEAVKELSGKVDALEKRLELISKKK